MPSPSHARSRRRLPVRPPHLACMTGVSLIALVFCVAVGGRAYGEPQDQAQTQDASQTQSPDQSQDPLQGQDSNQAQPVTVSVSDAPDDDDIRVLEAISIPLNDIWVRMAPLGSPRSQWPISAESYIRQAKRGSWPGEDSRWPTDGSLDDPRTLVAICKACEDYINGQTPEHWETDGLRHPYEGGSYQELHFGLEELPLDAETGIIVTMTAESDDMGTVHSAVLWRGGTPTRYGSTVALTETVPEREDPPLADGVDEDAVLEESVRELRKALASDAVMAGRRFAIPKPYSFSDIQVYVFEGKNDELLGYPLRTEEGLLALMESLGDVLLPDMEIIVSSVDGKQDVVGYCVNTCDHSGQPVVELVVERYASKVEAEKAFNMPFAVPAELNGREPYAWDVAVTRSRENHDCGAVPRPVLIVRYGSPSDVEGVIVMGDYLLNDVCGKVFENEYVLRSFRSWGSRDVDVPGTRSQGRSSISICNHGDDDNGYFGADWYNNSNVGRTYEYLLVAKHPDDANVRAIDNYALKVNAQTCLGQSEIERVELPMSTKAFLFGLTLVACVVLVGLL